MNLLPRRKTELRRFTGAVLAVVLTLAIAVGSLAVGGEELATDRVDGNRATTELINYKKTAPKPCRKTMLPGVNTSCPSSNLTFVAISADESDHAVARLHTVAHWSVNFTKLDAQCDRFSLYRPPCLSI